MTEDPTQDTFVPVNSEESGKSKLCLSSFQLGTITHFYSRLRYLSLEQAEMYLNICNELNHEPDVYMLNYIKKHYDYHYKWGKHIIRKSLAP